ncbi:hypothetical protein [Streptomyces sp. SID486]|uniref:hypothetical protein n=1 Tax=Streptomyces sp. SID486 TaxID=2690264 RepID=UPI001F20946B|nr:hypothetical protein [Streptomyces sp. SID486]
MDRQRAAADLNTGGRGPFQHGPERAGFLSGPLAPGRGRGAAGGGPAALAGGGPAAMAGGGPAAMAGGQSVPVRLLDDADAAADGSRVDGQERLAVGVGIGAVQHDPRLRGPELLRLAGPDASGGHRAAVAAERDQAVLADRPQMPLGHQTRSRRQRLEGRVVAGTSLADDIPMRLVDPGPSLRHPGH